MRHINYTIWKIRCEVIEIRRDQLAGRGLGTVLDDVEDVSEAVHEVASEEMGHAWISVLHLIECLGRDLEDPGIHICDDVDLGRCPIQQGTGSKDADVIRVEVIQKD